MKKLTLLFYILMMLGFMYGHAQILVASYPFNGNANDATGNVANNGTVNGATLTTDRFGNANRAYNFNGSTNFIEAAADNLPSGTADRTISLWFNADIGSVANRPGVLGYGGNATGTCPGNSFLMIINISGSAKYQTQAHCLNNEALYTYPSAPENNWYNWVITVKGSVIKMYINGVLVSTASTFTQPTIVAGKKLSIGAVVGPNGTSNYTDANVGHFKGKIDDIKIYTGAMTDQQVIDKYAAESLVASYPFNGNANDASGNGNNGTVNGATLTADRFGNANSAYSFNGTSTNYIQVLNSPGLQLSNSYTLEAWVKPNAFYTGANQSNFILSKGGQYVEGHYNLQYGDFLDGNPGVLTPSQMNFASVIQKSGTEQGTYENPVTQPVELNKWYYVVTTFDGTTLRLYVNGKLRVSNIITGTFGALSTQDLFIGKSGDNIYYVNGIIDDVKISNIPLSATQIFDTYVNDLKKPGSGNGMQLTGTGSLATSPYLNIGSGFDFGTQPFSYETWVKRDVIGTTLNNFGKALIVGDNNGAWAIAFANDNTLFFSQVGINVVFSTAAIADTKWHHVAVVYTGTQIQFYIDGIAAGNPAYNANFNNTSGNYFIGPRQSFGNSNGDQTLDGRIDETRIWRNIALTQTQIRNWMCRKVTSTHPAYANLFAYYRFDEGATTTTGGYNGKFGTLINSPVWVTSGASLGDTSVNDYTNVTKTVTLAALTGETFTATSTSGNPDGIQVYRVDTLPNSLNGTSGVGGNKKYFGVFQINGTSPQYTAIYNYNGNPFVNATNESNLRLFKRADNSATLWTMLSQTPNTTSKTITITGESTEYILGSLGNPLATSILSFNGYRESRVIRLMWQTTNEINLSGYEMQRSADGINFIALGNQASLNSIVSNDYSFTDYMPNKGANYYRVKQVDADGKFNYSKIIRIDFSEKIIVQVYPNPASDKIYVEGIQHYKYISITDVGGKKVYEQKITQGSETINISNLLKGVYIIRLTGDDDVQSLRFLKK